MRGRTIYYRNRRILVFCGEKRNTPHSANDLFSTAAETATTGENTETFTTDTNAFPESESGGAVGSDDDTFITFESKQAERESEISLPHTINGTVYRHIMASVGDDVSISNSTKAIKTISTLSKGKSGASTGETVKTFKTYIPKFTESNEGIATGEKNNDFITSQHYEAESESGISTRQNVEPYNETPKIIIAGVYGSQNDIRPLENLNISLPITYISNNSRLITRDALSVEYKSGYSKWFLYFWWQGTQVSMGSAYEASETACYWVISSLDGHFTITSDTEVTNEQFTIFNRYFKLIE